MKKFVLSLLFFYSFSVFAQTGTVLGIPEGTYVGSDVLISQVALVPNLDFTTTRILRNGMIAAKTKGFLLGHEVGGAYARLKVVMKGANAFVLEDMDRPTKGGYEVAGNGTCTASACTFSATVMNGELKLSETWSRGGENEFFISNGWQNLKGIISTYTGRLTRF